MLYARMATGRKPFLRLQSDQPRNGIASDVGAGPQRVPVEDLISALTPHEMTTGDSTRAVRVRLRYEFVESEDRWDDAEILIPADMAVDRLPLRIEQKLREKLEHVGHDGLQHGKKDLYYVPVIKFGDERDRYVNTDDDGNYHIQLIIDLFHDANVEDLGLLVLVSLQWRVSHAISNYELQDRIHNARPSRPYTYYRLGTVVPESQSGETVDVGPIPSEWTLVGWYHHGKATNGLQLSKAHAWNINSMLLGDCDGAEEVKRLSKKVKLDEQYQSAGASKQELQKLLDVQCNVQTMATSGGIPLLPTYCFNTPDSVSTFAAVAAHGRIREHIHIGLRFVNQFNNGLVLPVDIQLSFKESDDFQTICQKLGNTLKDTDRSGGQASPQALFDSAMAGKWDWELWVLPQFESHTKLYRFQDGTLKKFLNASRVAEGDFSLYTEAHIVPGSEWIQEAKRKRLKRS